MPLPKRADIEARSEISTRLSQDGDKLRLGEHGESETFSSDDLSPQRGHASAESSRNESTREPSRASGHEDDPDIEERDGNVDRTLTTRRE